ncbi:MAG: hypothetical protein IJ157_04310 [Clostridia bacterium]|nr:hypothetical protein [Clostridia bacterium]
MRKKSTISFGPGASSLVLIFVVLSMSVLGMLALMNGRNDARLSERSAQVIEAAYRLSERAEERRAELDGLLAEAGPDADIEALLPEDMYLEDGAVCWQETDGSRVLDCALKLLDADTGRRMVWLRHDLTAETEEIWE